MPRFLNVSLSAELSSKVLVNSPPYFGYAENACRDVSLYRRFVDSGLTDLVMGPQLASGDSSRSLTRVRVYVDPIGRPLTPDEAHELDDAIAHATADRTLIYSEPYHAAVGVKP